MMNNKEEQADELLALSSIYSESLFYVIQDGDENGGQFMACPELQSPFEIIYKSGTGDLIEHLQVEFLPPIVLHFQLPIKYPSLEPPNFTLSCKWLNREQLSKLCQRLDTIWDCNKGEVVLYEWIQFLKDDSLCYLSMNCLDLSVAMPSCKKITPRFAKSSSFNDLKKLVTDQITENGERVRAQTLSVKSRAEPSFDNKNLKGTRLSNEELPKSFEKRRSKPRKITNKPRVNNAKRIEARPFNIEVPSSVNNRENRDVSDGWQDNSTPKLKPQFGRPILMNGASNNLDSESTENVFADNPEVNGYEKSNPVFRRIEGEQKENVAAVSDLPNNYRTRHCSAGPSHVPSHQKCKFDTRAIQDCGFGAQLLHIIREYDQQQRQKVFEATMFTCGICFVEKLGSQCAMFINCKHVFCKDCVRTYFEVQINEGNVLGLCCPEYNCKSETLPSLIRDLVNPELYLKYDRLLLSATLDTMSDIRYCPRQSCQCPVITEHGSDLASCPACFFVFCIYCKMAYHGIAPCRLRPEEQRTLVTKYLDGTLDDKKSLELRYGRKQLQQLVDNVLSENWVDANSKACPHCSAPIEKSDGCNKMSCWRCQSLFCWLCMCRLSATNPYQHYNNPESRCFTLLFQGVDEIEGGVDDDWEFGQFLEGQ